MKSRKFDMQVDLNAVGLLHKNVVSGGTKRQATNVCSSTVINLPHVDKEKLKKNLMSFHPLKTPVSRKAICNRRPTKAQLYKVELHREPRLEPLPALKHYQKINNPNYIRCKALERCQAEGIVFDPEAKRRRGSFTDEPPEKSPSVLFSEELREKQLIYAKVEPEVLKPIVGPRHTEGPVMTAVVTPIDASNFYGLRSMKRIIKVIRDHPQIGFLYLKPGAPKSSMNYHYYHLKVCDYHDVNKADLITISIRGIVREVEGDEPDFIPLDRWEEEFKYFKKLVKLRLFTIFRMWKAFNMWKHNIMNKNMQFSEQMLMENLFCLNTSLQPAMMKIRTMCVTISSLNIGQFEKNHTYTLSEFMEAHLFLLQQGQTRISEFHDMVKNITFLACRDSVINAGFTPDDFYDGINVADPSRLMDPNYDPEFDDKVNYTEQANKRIHCARLTRFIRLIDFLVYDSLHALVVNTITALCEQVNYHLNKRPRLKDVKGWLKLVAEALKPPPQREAQTEEKDEKEKEVTEVGKSEVKDADKLGVKKKMNDRASMKPDQKVKEEEEVMPLFVVEFNLGVDDLLFMPNVDMFWSQLSDVINNVKNAALKTKNLLSDIYFDVFTRPIINKAFEMKSCGNGPNLYAVIADNKLLADTIKSIEEGIYKGFRFAKFYSDTFKQFHDFYHENETLDLAEIKVKPQTLGFFANSLTRYDKQIKMCEVIVTKKNLGLLLVDATKMKELILPSPRKCLHVIHEILPLKARLSLDKISAELQESLMRIELKCMNTTDYVSMLTFLNQIQERLDPFLKETRVVSELYELIERFKVPTPPEDYAMHLSMGPAINNLLNSIDKAVGERDKNVVKFCAQLQKDIAELYKDMKLIKQEAQNPILLDPTIPRFRIRDSLEMLQERVNELIEKSNLFKGYQKTIKVPVTKYEELDELNGEVKLKKLLWDALDQWDATLAGWMKANFNTLNPEELTQTVLKFNKTVYQLEKGLIPNPVVPKLKERVESMKEKLPVITDLRNPNIRPRHMELIEAVLKFNFTPDNPMTMGKLIQLGAFRMAEQIQEISGQASSEASLESLLKKVEDSWKIMEFPTVTYKDVKDIFILGGTDDIQALLDESNINISTIASSKHAGPIRARVDEWVHQLELFGKTFDAWQNCQRDWIYLESIFSAPDIQRQLPVEAKLFVSVDKSYKDIMRKVNKVPLAIRAGTQPGLLEVLNHNNSKLEQIQKCLEAYLESKRVVFSRFYFLSNDELLEILSQTRNPQAVQPHLRKCFDAIAKLEFGVVKTDTEPLLGKNVGEPMTVEDKKEEIVYTNDIVAMMSPEGEKISLGRGLKARGNVEDWLCKVEEAMVTNLHKLSKVAILDYKQRSREQWVLLHSSQVVLTISQLEWGKEITQILDGAGSRLRGMQLFEQKSFANLNKLASLVRGKLSKLARGVLCALITIDVHARDMVSEMVKNQVRSSDNFEWQKQLRYYWDPEKDDCIVRMSSSIYNYGYEYQGCSPRLVITPLTDRCYLCLMGALQLDLGGAPAGPAGTGKTETTKDLAKSLAKQCVVFNCSDGLDYKMMGRFFSGLAQSGAWCCFDEFNRIDIEVLSVIAQQLITIRNAKTGKMARFMFEGREIKLDNTCAAFITMNPGYAGRTELPDNLKALFRPIAMMVPDYRLIAEVILYSEGFESSKILAQKMTQMYKLCSEQLSQQDHYDFGMRAVKSVLVMAGGLKRQNPDKSENVVLIRALRDSNLPKFLNDDAVLFQAILNDLFPGIEIPDHDYGQFQKEIENVAVKQGLEIVPSQTKKVIQLYETMIVRHGVMLVGPTGGAKTTVYRILADACKNMNENAETYDSFFLPVHTYVMNPKSITMGELYGDYNKLTMEWNDGLMGITVRYCVQEKCEDHQWVICDGPVDALWIENMNTVLDDNKMLCLANSERIKFTPYIHMLFEVQDLAVASPATVSRCGMVYVDPDELKWMPYVKTWIRPFAGKVREEIVACLLALFEKIVEDGLKYASKKCVQAMTQVDISKVVTLCKLLEVLLLTNPDIDLVKMELPKLLSLTCTVFVFCYLWAVFGNTVENNRDAIDTFVRRQFEETPDAKLPIGGDIWSCYIDFKSRRMENWEKLVPVFKYNPDTPFFEILVPTEDTVRFAYLLEKLIAIKRSVLFTGGTGVGKSVIARGALLSLSKVTNIVPVFLNFSAQTSSSRTQEMIEGKMEKKRRTILGAPAGKRVIILVDDLNMPKLDMYGSQPPIELLRQFQDFGGLYDREKLFWKELRDMTICAACAPPGGGRNPVSPRFIRHFSMLSIPVPSEISLKHMFTSILEGFFFDFPYTVRNSIKAIVGSAKEIYSRMSTDFLPTPAKSHYVFNLRDLSKCIQGILQCDINTIRDSKQIYRLFCHEALRIFHDRLINFEDKQAFCQILADLSLKFFNQLTEPSSFVTSPILFGDYMKIMSSHDDRSYEELPSIDKIKAILADYLYEYCTEVAKEMKLVFFMDAVEHVTRIARMIRQQRGNALLVGVGGCGKQSLTRLGSYMCGYKCFQIEIRRGYDYVAFHDDLKKLYEMAGVQNLNTVFLFTDTQIVVEEFLEDINNILNSGEVPNLFESEEMAHNIISTRPAAVAAGIPEGNRDAIYEYFINRVRNNLHIVLCMSPVGSAFRSRCRMFPSLVNCCTIDWFTEWPEEALLSVSKSAFDPVDLGSEELKKKIGKMCMEIHVSVGTMAKKFYNELKRYYYTTPTSYLELISLYLNMVFEKKRKINNSIMRVKNGLTKLLETNIVIDKMKAELLEMEPILVAKTEATVEMTETLAADQEKADLVRKVVKEEESFALTKAAETKAIADDAQKDLDEALPALESAVKALDALDKSDISEIRVFTKPPPLVQTVMEAVCILLHTRTDWQGAKIVLGDTNFLKRLFDYDKDNIPEKTLQKLKKYIDNPKFTPEAVEKVSRACRSLCLWVRAIDLYAHVFRLVEPKRKKLAAAQTELEQVMASLKQKQKKLKEVELHIAQLEAAFEETYNEKVALEESMMLAQARIFRAGKLTSALADEKIRWEQSIEDFNVQLSNVVGDVFVSAACIAYYGAFTNTYRQELVALWTNRCIELQIPVSKTLTIVSVLVDSFEIRQWNTDGLPRDQVSIENATLVTRGRRWPLMIDPQEQANRWIRSKEASAGLKVTKLTDSGFLRTLEVAIRLGNPVLLEDIGESLDPSLEPILLRQTFVQGGRLLIRLGDSDIEYDKNFKLYMTTKLANPHYLPEVCIKVTIINFTVTKQGLEDQLLSEVSSLERPDLEEQRNQLILKINSDKAQMKAIEDRTLKLLFESEGNILDNEELINTLNNSKATSVIIMERLKQAETTEEKISISRETYRVVATRGSTLYFVVANLAEVDPMYQFSLKYFKYLFNNTIQSSEQSKDLQKRLQILLSATTADVYRNVARALFEKDKLVFSFMLCVEIMKIDNKIQPDEWSYFLRGSAGVKKERPPKPNFDWLKPSIWKEACDLETLLPSVFQGLPEEIRTTPCWVQSGSDVLVRLNPAESPSYMPPTPEPDPSELQPTKHFKGHWNVWLNDFQKLVFIKSFKEEKVILAVTNFVRENLGMMFIEPPATDLPTLYSDMNNVTPLVFVLSSGSDPMGAFLRFAREMDYHYRIQSISLGQGQGPVATKLLRAAFKSGDWVYLQNCHLAASWMVALEAIVKEMSEKPRNVHDDFRLFLSSMPAKSFPVAVLQTSVKVVNEPPKGIRSNLKRSFLEISAADFEGHELGLSWTRIVLGMCLFHAVILERKKFGPLGWNIKYEFADSDRECALLNLKMFCAGGVIPWDALIYITGEITYGGRVTDQWDQRCLRTVLKYFFHPDTLTPDYKFSKSGIYYAPMTTSLAENREYIDSLPTNDEPEIFGMHDNANIAFQVQETAALVVTILNMQPRLGGGGGGQSNDDIVYGHASDVLGQLKDKLDIEEAKPEMFQLDAKGRLNSLTTVLMQEVARFNKLLHVIKDSLQQLKKAIRGFVVMSEELERVYMAFLYNQVPKLWADAAYPSMKPMGSWVKDLVLRCKFVTAWIRTGAPKSFWLSGFFFPQGFLTGVLQNHARKYSFPVDQLSFKYIVLSRYLDQAEITAQQEQADGAETDIEKSIKVPTDGVLVHGLFMDGFRWDDQNGVVEDSLPAIMHSSLPMLHMEPQIDYEPAKMLYHSPLYKTALRAGVLSTTGHSTNFVVTVYLPSKRPQDYWICKGSALLCQLSE